MYLIYYQKCVDMKNRRNTRAHYVQLPFQRFPEPPVDECLPNDNVNIYRRYFAFGYHFEHNTGHSLSFH